MNLKQLEYFRTLARTEHYTKASKELYITQPSLSYSITELEKELKTHLFEKDGRNIKLTKYGSFFLSYVERALDELETGKKQLLKLTSSTEGKIDMAFIYTLGPTFIPNLVQSFSNNKEYEGIKFSFAQGNTKSLIEDLKREKFDLIFCSYKEDEPEIEFVPVAKQDLVLIVPQNHPLGILDTIDLKATEDYPYILFNQKSGLRPIINDMFNRGDINPEIICEVEEDSAVAGLVSIGYGIAIIPKIPNLSNFNVKIINIEKPLYERYIYAARCKNLYHSPAMLSFFSFALNYGKENYLNKNIKV
ncbi:LysR family transcriptional regulator [Clostridium felsineum]|uniref:LysR family transcriptional regulator n=1 Tax=Clostridium felsineum TaxID=36839 RepID=UPI00098BDC19|nr:LysR family transcriptional regulator [Clostridium felsineum]URZ03953.1 HTH-type transcriptional regulator GltC [Clostridium felsineum]